MSSRATGTFPSRTPARRDIQGLRAAAVVAVVLAHVMGWPRGGFVGVDVFFVISGFLITGLLIRELGATGRISLRAFAARRVRRILPAALVVLLAVVVAGFFVFHQARAEQTLGDAVAASALVANWRFALEGTDYFAAGEAVSPLQHFWSLSVEEQFYLVWPGLLLILVLFLPVARRRGRAGRAVVAAAATAVVLASGGWALSQSATDATVAYFSTLTRAWELGVGALVAVAAPVLARMPAAVRWLLGWAGLAGILASFVVIDPATMPFPGPWAALPVAATAAVIAGGVGGDPRHRHLFPLTNPLAVLVGNLSYSLYLWHFPVLVFAGVILPPDATAAVPIVLTASAVLAVTTYFLIEQPLHHSPWLRRWERGPREEVHSPESAVIADAIPRMPVASPSAAVSVAAGASVDAAGAALPAAVPAADAAAPPSAAPALRLGSTRPAGWTPGTRYYPGSRPATTASAPSDPALLTGGAPSDRIDDARTGDAPPESAPSAHVLVPPPRPDRANATATDPEPAPEPEPATSPWAAWRARFAAQMGLAATGLAIGAGVLVLVVQVTLGGPVLGPLLPPPPVADEAVDTSALVEAELAAAVSASTWPELHPSLDEVIAQSSGSNPAHDCFAPEVAADLSRCTWGDSAAPRHMYLVGDSSAMAYAPAFRKIAEDSGGAWRVTTVGMYGCRFTDVLVQNSGAGVMQSCPQRKADVRAMVAADPADLVVVSNAFTLGRTVDGRDLSAPELLAATRAEVGGYGAESGIVYLAPPPRGGDLARCYSPLTEPGRCLTAVDPTWHAMEAAAEGIAAETGDHVIDALPFSCWQEVCPAFAGSLPVRYDETHITVAYAEHIAPVLRARLVDLGLF